MTRANLSLRAAAAIVASGLLCSGIASAYESENGVPLTIAAAIWKVQAENVSIRLQGRDVTVSAVLYNNTKSPQFAAWYAYTPLFHQLGEGESHLDKSFSDLRVLVRGQPKKIEKQVRAYFMGRDITERLVKAGIDPTPSLDVPYTKLNRIPKVDGVAPEDWDASITYAWSDRIASGERSTHEIRYRDLPQFGPEEISSDSFSRRIRQYCGDPERVRARIKQAYPDAQLVVVERHEFPLPSMALGEVTLEATQPARNWLGARPLISLACGIDNPKLLPDIKGVLSSADQTLHLMTISIDGVAEN
jgi:hypothetical protein